jgi:signal transduction histidine kinase
MKPVFLMPHAVCWAASPGLIWTMVVTNAVTFLSYSAMCAVLMYLARRTGRVMAREWRYFLIGFALFIVACGSTHLLEVITTWDPVFWIDAGANLLTAILSAVVCAVLIRRAVAIAGGINDYAGRLSQAEEERMHLRESLLASQKLEEWSRIAASVSHEIRGPLEAIQNLQYLIVNAPDIPADVASMARTALEETHRVVTISQSTLSFMRQSKAVERIDLRGAVDSVRSVLKPLIQERAISLEVSTHGDCFVEAYAGEIRQILLNVIRNACEAAATPGAAVRVALTGGRSGVEVLVEDEGPGIAPEIAAQLFEFGVSTKAERGNGMGLWTVKHLLSKHGGQVQVVNRGQKGACFRLWWPRVAPSHQAA